jgi:CCR4-NOT transcriptional regulation complex NOT5 subunit
MDKLEQIEKEEQEEKIDITLFNIEQLEKSLDKLKTKCLEPFLINNFDLEENKEIITYFLFIKESFKTLNLLQILIKEKG